MSDETRKQEQTTQKAAGNAKQERARLKHNRNAEAGLKLPDLNAEASAEAAVAGRLRGHRVHRTYDDSWKAKIVECRRHGHTYRTISSYRGYPSEQHIQDWLHDDPAFAESCRDAYDEYIRAEVETSMRLVGTIDNARGVTDEPLEILAQAVVTVLQAKEVDPVTRAGAVATYSKVMLQHARVRSSVRALRVKRALEIAERRLPGEWGRDRDQGQEVIVIETPGGWMMDAASAGLDDPNGQGPAAKEAAERWRKMKDVTP